MKSAALIETSDNEIASLEHVVWYLNHHEVSDDGSPTVIEATPAGIVVQSIELSWPDGGFGPMVKTVRHQTIKPTLRAARGWLGY